LVSTLPQFVLQATWTRIGSAKLEAVTMWTVATLVMVAAGVSDLNEFSVRLSSAFGLSRNSLNICSGNNRKR
jgi:hypothetical protein